MEVNSWIPVSFSFFNMEMNSTEMNELFRLIKKKKKKKLIIVLFGKYDIAEVSDMQ